MHTLAAYFPDQPLAEEQAAAAHFMRAVGALFPCGECAEDFRHEMGKSAPRTASRAELSVWVCEQHNHVNEKLGKPLFACDIARLDRRWRFGGKQCEYQMDDEPAAEPGTGGGSAPGAGGASPLASGGGGATPGAGRGAPAVASAAPPERPESP